MEILVTGGAGFIGSNIADACINAGDRVTIIDNLSTGRREFVPESAEFYCMDICDRNVEEIFKNKHFDAIMHLAAQIDVRKSVRDPVFDAQVNICGSVGLLELAVRYNIKKFIFASTGGALYGEQDYFPADENHPVRPISPYGVAKASVEKYMYFYNVQYQIDTIALRLANVYGQRQNPLGEAGVVAIFTHKMLCGEPAFINGDGRQTRDYVNVMDVVRAFRLALGLNGYYAINIGTGIETDVISLFDEINYLTGNKTVRRHNPPAVGEQQRSVIDNRLAKEILNWQPEIDIKTGLRMTVDWFKNQMVDTNKYRGV